MSDGVWDCWIDGDNHLGNIDLWQMKQKTEMPLIDLSHQFKYPEPFSLDIVEQGLREYLKEKEPMKKQVFQYMVLLHEYEMKDGKEEYKDSKVIIDLKTVMAKSEKELVFKITREIPEEFAANPEHVEIKIRNF